MWNLPTIIICFFFYCFLGWCCEEVYCCLPARRFLNRGFLYGPYLPIYGTGAMTVVLFLEPFQAHPVLIFLLGMLLCSSIEYIAHFGMEKLLKIKLWDYSTYRFNLNGRVCLLNSSLFGLLSLVLIYLVNARVQAIVFAFSYVVQITLSSLIVVLLSVDTIFSVLKMNAFKKAMQEIMAITSELDEKGRELFYSAKKELQEHFKDQKEMEALLQRLRERRYLLLSRVRYVLRDNPTLDYAKHDFSLSLLHARLLLEERRGEIRLAVKKYKEKKLNGSITRSSK